MHIICSSQHITRNGTMARTSVGADERLNALTSAQPALFARAEAIISTECKHDSPKTGIPVAKLVAHSRVVGWIHRQSTCCRSRAERCASQEPACWRHCCGSLRSDRCSPSYTRTHKGL